MLRSVIIAVALSTVLASTSEAQLATVGAGVLLSKRSPQPVGELHAESPPFHRTRAYITLSWTDDSSKPTVISAAERSVLHVGRASVGIGAGLLWLEVNDYKPYPIVVSSTVVPLPVRRTSIVGIASTQPFQDFELSFVLKLGILVWFVR
jgi:hypothetical protein